MVILCLLYGDWWFNDGNIWRFPKSSGVPWWLGAPMQELQGLLRLAREKRGENGSKGEINLI